MGYSIQHIDTDAVKVATFRSLCTHYSFYATASAAQFMNPRSRVVAVEIPRTFESGHTAHFLDSGQNALPLRKRIGSGHRGQY